MHRSRPLALVLAVAAALTPLACSSDDDATPTPTDPPVTAAAATPSAAGTASDGTVASSAASSAEATGSSGTGTPSEGPLLPGPVGVQSTASGTRIHGLGRALFAAYAAASDRTFVANTLNVAFVSGDDAPSPLAGSPATRLAMSPDSTLVAALMANGSISTWDTATLQNVDDIAVPDINEAMSLAFAGQNTLVVGDAERVTLHVLDPALADIGERETLAEEAADGGPLGPVTVGTGGTVAVPIAAPAPVVVTWTPGGSRATVDPGLGEGGRINAVLASPDGTHLAVVGATATGGDELIIWDVAAGARVGTPVPLANFVTPDQLAFPDRIVMPLVGRVAAFDLAGVEVASMPIGDSPVSTVQSARDGVLVTTVDGTAVRWVPGNAPSALGDPTVTLVDTDATDGIATVDQLGLVRSYGADGSAGQTITDFAVGELTSIAPVDDASFAVASSTGAVRVIDAETGATLDAFDRPQGAVTDVAVSPDASTLATAIAEQQRAEAWDDTVEATSLTDGSTAFELGGQAEDVSGCAFYEGVVRFSPDGTLLASSSHDFTVQVTPLADPDATTILPPHLGTVYDLQFSTDGTQLVTTSDDGSLRVWQVDDWQLLGEHRGAAGAYTSLAFAPDGTLVASTASGDISVVDLATGAPTRTFDGQRTVLGSMAFGPDGTKLYAPLDDGAVGVWDVASGTVVDELVGHSQAVTAIAVSADGTRLLTSSRDGTARSWALAS